MSETDKLTQEEGKSPCGDGAEKDHSKGPFQSERPYEQDSSSSPKFQERRGTLFVTLTINGALRGCIGHIIAQESLMER